MNTFLFDIFREDLVFQKAPSSRLFPEKKFLNYARILFRLLPNYIKEAACSFDEHHHIIGLDIPAFSSFNRVSSVQLMPIGTDSEPRLSLYPQPIHRQAMALNKLCDYTFSRYQQVLIEAAEICRLILMSQKKNHQSFSYVRTYCLPKVSPSFKFFNEFKAVDHTQLIKSECLARSKTTDCVSLLCLDLFNQYEPFFSSNFTTNKRKNIIDDLARLPINCISTTVILDVFQKHSKLTRSVSFSTFSRRK